MPKKGSKPLKPAAKVSAKKSRVKLLDSFVIGNVLQVRMQIKPKERSKQPTDKIHEDWFFKLSHKEFTQLTRDWNDVNLKIELEAQKDYDHWLNYFKAMSPNQIKMLAQTGMDILPTEGYAALSRWHDIISNPGRIDKIHKAGLTGGSTGKEKSISELAEANDRYGVLKAIRGTLARKLQNGAGNRDTSDLSKQMMEVMTQIADYERRLAPDKKTVLGDLLSDMPTGNIKSKRPAKNGGGARQGSFRSRVTIKDIEGN